MTNSEYVMSMLLTGGSRVSDEEMILALREDQDRVSSVLDMTKFFEAVKGITPWEMIGVMTGKGCYDISAVDSHLFSEAEIAEIVEQQKNGRDVGLTASHSNFFFTKDTAGKMIGVVVFALTIHKLEQWGGQCATGARFFSKLRLK